MPQNNRPIETGFGVAVVLGTMLLATGCNSAQTGTLLGAAIGSAAGAGIDYHDRGRGALIGAGLGAVSGYLIGNEFDKTYSSDVSSEDTPPKSAYRKTSPAYTEVYVYEHHYVLPPPYVHYHHGYHHRRHHHHHGYRRW